MLQAAPGLSMHTHAAAAVQSTSARLCPLCVRAPQAEGFSDVICDTFFRPFMGGIFFDRNLGTSSRLFQFVM